MLDSYSCRSFTTLDDAQFIVDTIASNITELKGLRVEEIKDVDNLDDVSGCCESNIVSSPWSYDGKFRYLPIKVDKIKISMRSKNRSFLLVVLHELAHCLTPYVEVKIGKKWYRDDHSDKFYNNYVRILRIAKDKKIYKGEVNIKHIKRLDNYHL